MGSDAFGVRNKAALIPSETDVRGRPAGLVDEVAFHEHSEQPFWMLTCRARRVPGH